MLPRLAPFAQANSWWPNGRGFYGEDLVGDGGRREHIGDSRMKSAERSLYGLFLCGHGYACDRIRNMAGVERARRNADSRYDGQAHVMRYGSCPAFNV
jgi:hypothetical protein